MYCNVICRYIHGELGLKCGKDSNRHKLWPCGLTFEEKQNFAEYNEGYILVMITSKLVNFPRNLTFKVLVS